MSASSRRGFTLVELLLALALGAMLTALVGRIAVAALASRQYAEEALGGMERRAILFEALADDFAALLPGIDSERGSIVVFGMPQPVLEIASAAAMDREMSALHAPYRPALVRYRSTATPDQPDERIVVREVLDLTDPAAVVIRQTLATNVESFEVAVLQAGEWSAGTARQATGRQATARDRVTAVRVSVRWKGSDEVFIRTFPSHDAH